MSELLIKKQILEGTRGTTAVHIEGLGGEVEIRALTDGQWAQIQQVATKGLRMTVRRKGAEQEFDAGIGFANDHSSDLLTCRLGLVEAWTDAELGQLPAGTVGEISTAIQNFSGVAKNREREEEIARMAQSFCDEPGGGDDSVSAPDGIAARPDPK